MSLRSFHILKRFCFFLVCSVAFCTMFINILLLLCYYSVFRSTLVLYRSIFIMCRSILVMWRSNLILCRSISIVYRPKIVMSTNFIFIGKYEGKSKIIRNCSIAHSCFSFFKIFFARVVYCVT